MCGHGELWIEAIQRRRVSIAAYLKDTGNVKAAEKIENIGNIIILDIENLLFLVQGNEPLKSAMLSILDFSVNDLLPENPNVQLFNLQEKPTLQPARQGTLLKERITNWVNSNGNTEYENLCYEIHNLSTMV